MNDIDPPVIDPNAPTPPTTSHLSEHKDTPPSNDKDPSAPLTLTYTSTQSSHGYVTAKKHLHKGDFESALSLLEATLAQLLSQLSNKEDKEHHECLAPLYYLYGTTLLYSIEECPEAELSLMDATELDEELQISWENLEMARSILHKLSEKLDKDSLHHATESGPSYNELTLELAQVHLRLGDLSRHNGNYQQSIHDYETCRTIRRQLLGSWDRKVADIEYSLGMVCFLLAVEEEKSREKQQRSIRQGTETNTEETPTIMSVEETDKLRQRSIGYYLECGRVIGGIVGSLCGKDPMDIVNEEVDVSSLEVLTIAKASSILHKIRDNVSILTCSDEVHMDTVHDMKELLDEIQESIDTTEEDRIGLNDVSRMKQKVEEEVEAKNNKEGDTNSNLWNNLSGHANKISNDSKKLSKHDNDVEILDGSKVFTGPNDAAKQVPMMLVRKKQKRDTEGKEESMSSDNATKKVKCVE